METCYEPLKTDAGVEPGDASRMRGRWRELRAQWNEWRELVGSEWNAAYEALRGPEPARKWLGWALYRLATRVNPEIRD